VAVGAAYTSFEGYKDESTGETVIGLSYDKLCSHVKPGGRILMADGSLAIEVGICFGGMALSLWGGGWELSPWLGSRELGRGWARIESISSALFLTQLARVRTPTPPHTHNTVQ